jgi:hypothetical protein
MVNPHSRYQVGLTLNKLYPIVSGLCACGCSNELPKSRKKWFSNECRTSAYLNFAVIKGDLSVIRHLLYERDQGACMSCGEITSDWEADHIVPVHKGGGGCDLSNFQTLCVSCHIEKTHILSHHKAISSHATSIFFKRSLRDDGQDSIVLLKTSKEKQTRLSGIMSALASCASTKL